MRTCFVAARFSGWLLLLALAFMQMVSAQSGNSTSVNGTVLDPTGAVVPNATVEVQNPVSHFERSLTTDASGNFALRDAENGDRTDRI